MQVSYNAGSVEDLAAMRPIEAVWVRAWHRNFAESQVFVFISISILENLRQAASWLAIQPILRSSQWVEWWLSTIVVGDGLWGSGESREQHCKLQGNKKKIGRKSTSEELLSCSSKYLPKSQRNTTAKFELCLLLMRSQFVGRRLWMNFHSMAKNKQTKQKKNQSRTSERDITQLSLRSTPRCDEALVSVDCRWYSPFISFLPAQTRNPAKPKTHKNLEHYCQYLFVLFVSGHLFLRPDGSHLKRPNLGTIKLRSAK